MDPNMKNKSSGVFLCPDSVFEEKFMVSQSNPSEPMPSGVSAPFPAKPTQITGQLPRKKGGTPPIFDQTPYLLRQTSS
jgi:hypothetical protein